MSKNLTSKDLEEGKEIAEIYAKLPETEKVQVRIYTQALADRNEIQEKRLPDDQDKKAG